eukprot:CAMPEP_0172421992 /NCGR_PEP_ID=MMETSP1064-20121228/8195_1 /TAXON_ID=202472 /ORGANISM="Aulacoseira subarctica , Strain CCAP 1002/5" /LENGTH=412 /DNA_ID=CAMNT_0013162635 /DNA_START=183 /DNA_END=1421 /DNA_ORIENTATION=+
MSAATASSRRTSSPRDVLAGLFPMCGGSSLKKIADSPIRTEDSKRLGGEVLTSRYLSEKGAVSSYHLPKTIYLIRHAESNENRRLECLARSIQHLKKLALPEKEDIVASVELLDVTAQLDSDVSDVGKRQIAQLYRKLQEDNFIENHKIQLVAHSPLRRARQTSEGMLGCVSPRVIDQSNTNDINRRTDERGAPSPLSVVSPCVPIPLPKPKSGHGPHGTLPLEEFNSPGRNTPLVSRIVELPCLMERTPMEWLNPAALDIRIEEFEEWLDSVPEERIAIVGHSQYFKTMLGLNYKFKNCDVWQLTYVSRTTPRINDCEKMLESKPRSVVLERNHAGSVKKSSHVVQERMLSILSSGSMGFGAVESNLSSDNIGKSWSDSDSAIEQPAENVDLPRGWSGLKMLYRYNPDEDN